MKAIKEEKDILEKILEGFNKDGTHMEFPIHRAFDAEAIGKAARSSLMLDIPALVVYEPNDDAAAPHVGIVFALSHGVDGVRLHVMSRHEGKIACHPIEMSPSGKRPAYLLVKKHLSMIHVP